MENDKERIKNINLEIEHQNNELHNQYKNLERENLGLDLKNKTIENMRINYALNNKYKNEINDFDEIGFNTSPNFGNYKGLNNLDNFNKFEKNNKKEIKFNGNDEISIFNKDGKRINADEYFQKFENSLKEKKDRNVDPNEKIDNYLIDGKNYINEIKNKRNLIMNENE